MTAHLALIEELNGVIATGTAQRRLDLLQRLSDLFVFGAADYSGDQISLFDDVFIRLVATIEVSARATLAKRLVDIPFAPPAISRTLAFDDAIDVAAPMLQRSPQLDDVTLVENARTKSQLHLLAISKRSSLAAAVADILVERGERPVVLSTAENPGARFSDAGYTTLVRRSEGDDELASCVGLRRDLPRHHLLRLLAKASETVRSKLEAADPLSATTIRSAIAEAVNRVQAKTTCLSRDYVAARAEVARLSAAGRLDDAAIAAFAQAEKFEESTVALAVLCDLPVEQVELAMAGDRPETVLILAKAVGVSWPTVKKILLMRIGRHGLSTYELDRCLGTFSRMKVATARQVLEFQRKRASPAA
jgi:uncharacterized protein (DUF2336 family)